MPTVSLVSPPNNITVVAGAALPLAAIVADPGGILASVQFLVNGTPVDTTSATAPYVFAATAPAAPGAYPVEAIATDTLGRTSTSSIVVNVVAPNPNAAAPASSLLTPINSLNLAAGSAVTLTATAAAASATALQQVSIFVDGAVIAIFDGQGNLLTSAHGGAPVRRDAASTPAGNPFTTSYTLPGVDQILNLIVVALDQLGQTTVSGVASFHSTVTTDLAPLVSISNFGPSAKVPVGSSNPVDVTASDPDAGAATAGATLPGLAPQDSSLDAILSQVAYFINGALASVAMTPPYDFTFTPPSDGKYVLSAVATDGAGLSTISEPVVVSTVPTVTVVAAGNGTAVEGGGAPGKVSIERTGDTSAPLTVRYKVKGSAVAGVDYKPLSGSVTIPAGASKAKVKIKPLDNPVAGTRKAKVKLLPATDGGYTLGDPAVATIKVIDE